MAGAVWAVAWSRDPVKTAHVEMTANMRYEHKRPETAESMAGLRLCGLARDWLLVPAVVGTASLGRHVASSQRSIASLNVRLRNDRKTSPVPRGKPSTCLFCPPSVTPAAPITAAETAYFFCGQRQASARLTCMQH